MLTRVDFLDLFWYDELSGKLYWQLPLHPRIKIGSEAGTLRRNYRHVKIDGKCYSTHRIIWVMLFGDIPNDKIIDHKNGIGDCNIRVNLRLATQGQNRQNTGSSRNSSSKFKGVSWHKGKRKWEAEIRVKGERYRLGAFNHELDARNAYDAFAKEMHGEFYHSELK